MVGAKFVLLCGMFSVARDHLFPQPPHHQDIRQVIMTYIVLILVLVTRSSFGFLVGKEHSSLEECHWVNRQRQVSERNIKKRRWESKCNVHHCFFLVAAAVFFPLAWNAANLKAIPYDIIAPAASNCEQKNKQTDIPRTEYHGFVRHNCASKDRYCVLLSDKWIVFVTAKFGSNRKFQMQVLERQQEAIATFHWLNASNAYGFYEVPKHWQKSFQNHTQFLQDPSHDLAT